MKMKPIMDKEKAQLDDMDAMSIFHWPVLRELAAHASHAKHAPQAK
jgi:hypothetical protein